MSGEKMNQDPNFELVESRRKAFQNYCENPSLQTFRVVEELENNNQIDRSMNILNLTRITFNNYELLLMKLSNMT